MDDKSETENNQNNNQLFLSGSDFYCLLWAFLYFSNYIFDNKYLCIFCSQTKQTQHWESTQSHWIIYFKEVAMATFMLCVFCHNKKNICLEDKRQLVWKTLINWVFFFEVNIAQGRGTRLGKRNRAAERVQAGLGLNASRCDPRFCLLQIRWEAFCNRRLFFFFFKEFTQDLLWFKLRPG